jgi:hypothetical protein
MKKNSFNVLGLTALALAIALVLSGCGFGAKNLARQVSDLTKQAAKIEKQTAELQAKAAEIEEKAAALSDKNRITYQEELTRLGFDAPEWLFNDAESLFNGAEGYTGGGTRGILGDLARMLQSLDGGGDNGNSSSGGSSTRGGGGKLTITGLPSGTYHVVVAAPGTDVSHISEEDGVAASDFGNGVFTLFDVKTSTQNQNPILWTGSGSWEVFMVSLQGVGWRTTVNFSNGSATVPFSRFTAITQ